jgi:glycosyltransferase involved in cell wall biosynthesis
MNQPPRLLYLAFWYPPSRASGVYRALATTERFAERGWDVTVITTSRRFLEEEIGSTDESLIDLIPESVKVVRVPHAPSGRPRTDPREAGWFRASYPAAWRKASAVVARMKATLRRNASTTAAVRDRYSGWPDAVCEAVDQLDLEFDHVLATGNPYAAFSAAKRVAETRGVSYSLDYRDPWTVDVYTGERLAAKSADLADEASAVSEAAGCFHVNKAIADEYGRIYPAAADRQYVVANGFDVASVAVSYRARAQASCRFGILGTANPHWPFEPMFDGWATARKELPEGSQLVLGGHLGYFARSQSGLRVKLPVEGDGFIYAGPIPKQEVAAFYSSLDVVIVPVGGGPLVTSGKVFEAAAVGVPVVCIQEDGGGARAILDGHPGFFPATPEASSVSAALVAARQCAVDWREEDFAAARKFAQPFERERALDGMVDYVSGWI